MERERVEREGKREEDLKNKMKQQQQSRPAPSIDPPPPPAKKRNQPGISYPDAEVIAMSPKSLMATNRFVCEVCNKGFQREQNLQLHRRGHNLPWKLRQKSSKQVKRRVYVCPEPTCVHHNPSRALGDLTGIKKHFSRKHGEKKWNCEKCSKRYAVQSDWKAHSKTCGTREYRCDCGTLFSRRDSFITHRAFCDALAQETARVPTGLTTIGVRGHLYGSNSSTGGSDMISIPTNHPRVGTHLDHLMPCFSSPPTFRPGPSSPSFLFGGSNQDSFPSLVHLPDPHNSSSSKNQHAHHMTSSSPSAATFFNNYNQNDLLILDQLNGGIIGGNTSEQFNVFSGNLICGRDNNIGSLYNNSNQSLLLPQMSATALLQKAAEMGATTTTTPNNNSNSNSNGSQSLLQGGFENTTRSSIQHDLDNEAHLQDLMNSLASGNIAGMFGQDVHVGGSMNTNINTKQNVHEVGGGTSNVLTRDFLGVGREHHPRLHVDSLDPKFRQLAYSGANFQ